MDTEAILEKLQRIRDLPTISPVAVKVLQTARDRNASAEQLARTLEKDAALCANLLKVANSSYYSFATRVTTVEKACVNLGFSTVRSIVLATSAIGAFHNVTGNEELDKTRFWRHSLAGAIATHEIMGGSRAREAADGYVVGLMHDLGKLLLDIHFPEEYRGVLLEADNGREPFEQVERRLLGIDHAQVGHWLMSRWQFPQSLSDPVAHHHRPIEELSAGAGGVSLAAAAALGNRLCHVLGITCLPGEQAQEIPEAWLAAVGLLPERIERIAERVQAELDAACSSMGIGSADEPVDHHRSQFIELSHEAGKDLRDANLELDSHARRLARKVDELAYLNDLLTQLEKCPGVDEAICLIASATLQITEGGEARCWIRTEGGEAKQAQANRSPAGRIETRLEALAGVPPQIGPQDGWVVHHGDLLRHGRRVGGLIVTTNGQQRDRSVRNCAALVTLTAHMAGTVLERIGRTQEYRQQAERLSRMHKMLAETHERLKAMHEEHVRQAKVHALGRVASGVAHDFNNILAAILGQAQLGMLRGDLTEVQRDLSIVQQAALNGAEVVKRIQQVARASSDARRRAAVDLNEVVAGALELTRYNWEHEAARKGIHYDVETECGEVRPISGNAEELKQALVNLILNALDAMETGGRLRIKTETAGDAVRVSIEDSGPGIPPHLKQKVFDPFFTTKGRRGSGLGLSIVEAVLNQHGGTVKLESGQGRGTRIILSFPIGDPDGAEPADAPAAAPRPAPQKVLVVEDEENIRNMIVEALSLDGHRPVSFSSGDEAVKAFADEDFGVVMTDLAMPGMSGWDVADAIRRLSSSVKILLVTGWGQGVRQEECAAHGVDGVLPKPFTINDLRDTLTRCVGC